MPPVKYNYFDADEAEAEFEKRNKTLNYFSVMLSKKMKNSEEQRRRRKGSCRQREADEEEGKKESSRQWPGMYTYNLEPVGVMTLYQFLLYL